MVTKAQAKRQQLIVDVLDGAFADLMEADPHAFRVKFRKMAADPFAFYRGSACLFYADMTTAKDAWADDRTSRVWIHGDLHAENFGTYMNSHGRMVFDVNDFDEAYIGHFSWDLLPVRGQPRADGLAEGAARRDGPRTWSGGTSGPTWRRSPLQHDQTRTTTSPSSSRTPTARFTKCSRRPARRAGWSCSTG